MQFNNFSRRHVLKLGTAAAASAASSCIFQPSWNTPAKRTVLACSDLHIGHSESNGNGTQCFTNALADIDNSASAIDYAIVLGESHSFVLTLEHGAQHIAAQRRIHNTASNGFAISIPLSFPLNIAGYSQRTRINA